MSLLMWSLDSYYFSLIYSP